MLENMPKDLKTHAYVLRRTNYGEADRILNLITPVGKISVIAKGVRKPKSKLAGGIEMFSLINVNLHFGKSDMAVLTGSKMEKFCGNILKDFERMELASEILKNVSKASDSVDSADFFEIVDECLCALNNGCNLELVNIWYLFNLKKVMGEQLNLYFDNNGAKLVETEKYFWDINDRTLVVDNDGPIDADVIKVMRLVLTAKLDVIRRIKNIESYLPIIFEIAKTI